MTTKNTADRKRSYQTPKVLVHGDVRALTQAGTGGGGEPASGADMMA